MTTWKSSYVRPALCLILAAACSDSSTGGGPGKPSDPKDVTQDVAFADTPQTPDTVAEDAAGPGVEKLDFKQVTGDDGQPCKGGDRCSVIMNYLGERLLEVVATRDGQPLETQISWKIPKNPNNSLKLASLETNTDPATGLSGNKVTQTASQTAQYEVTVQLKNSPKAPTLKFDVAVVPKGQVPLTVVYTYKGKRSFQGVTTLLFKQSPQGAPNCAKMDPTNLPTADTQGGPKGLTQSTQFVTLPDLDKDKKQKYTIVGIGADVNKPPLVWGCNDVDGSVDIEKPGTKVSIDLLDLPPKWKGAYDVTTHFDLVSALPDNVENVVNIILGFFTDPAGQLMVLACQFGGSVSVLSDLCGFVFADPAKPCIEDSCYKSVGLAVKSLIENALYSLLKDNIGGDILFTGQDVAKILKDLELKATFEFKKEPGADGTFSKDDTAEDWHTVTYRWSLGNNCDPTDEACGKYSFNIAAFQGETITSKFSGHVDYSTGDYLLNIDTHSINLKYGQLAKWIIEKEILPRIAGDGSDGNPKVDSFEKLIKSLLGGKACLKLDDCCEKFAASISGGTTGGFTSDLAKAACDALVPLAVGQLEKYLDGLDADSGENFTIATKDACKCFDLDANMTIDTWGSKTAPCHWDTTLKIGGYDTKIENDFWAVEQQ